MIKFNLLIPDDDILKKIAIAKYVKRKGNTWMARDNEWCTEVNINGFLSAQYGESEKHSIREMEKCLYDNEEIRYYICDVVDNHKEKYKNVEI